MVFGQTHKSTSISKPGAESMVLMVVLLAILTAATTLVLYYLIIGLQENEVGIVENIVID